MRSASSTDAVVVLPAARSVLSAAPASGTTRPTTYTVASAHPHALHLLTAEGEVLSIGDADAIALPTQWHLAHARPWWHGTRPGRPATLDGQVLRWRADNGRCMRVRPVRVWRPVPVRTGCLLGLPFERLVAFHEELKARASDLGTMTRALVDVATAALDDAVDVDALRSILGLGQGLTPSADDAVCGVLLAARALGRTLSDEAATVLHDLARQRTTALSADCLRAAAGGYAVPAVVELLGATATGDDLTDHLADICAIGHSSGRDLLGGLSMTLTVHCPALLATAAQLSRRESL